jgi:hypothetical protein
MAGLNRSPTWHEKKEPRLKRELGPAGTEIETEGDGLTEKIKTRAAAEKNEA